MAYHRQGVGGRRRNNSSVPRIPERRTPCAKNLPDRQSRNASQTSALLGIRCFHKVQVVERTEHGAGKLEL